MPESIKPVSRPAQKGFFEFRTKVTSEKVIDMVRAGTLPNFEFQISVPMTVPGSRAILTVTPIALIPRLLQDTSANNTVQKSEKVQQSINKIESCLPGVVPLLDGAEEIFKEEMIKQIVGIIGEVTAKEAKGTKRIVLLFSKEICVFTRE